MSDQFAYAKERYAAYGWRVLCIDGHDPMALYDAFRTAYA